jgi:hypothetical protein
MSHAPQTLRDLMRLWTEHDGANLGIVGDVAHQQKGVSYHLGKDQLKPDAYSIVQSARDRAGLSNAASAVDLGKLNGSLAQLFRFSRWLAAQCQERPQQYRDIREVIFSPDGEVVRRWDAVQQKLFVGGTGTGHGDDSHLTHTHVSFFRDSEIRDKRQLFEPFFVTEPEEPEVDAFVLFERRTFVTARKGARLYDNGGLRGRANTPERPGTPTTLGSQRELVHVGNVRGLVEGERVAIVGYEPPDGDPNDSSESRWVRWSELVPDPENPAQPRFRMVDDAAAPGSDEADAGSDDFPPVEAQPRDFPPVSAPPEADDSVEAKGPEGEPH